MWPYLTFMKVDQKRKEMILTDEGNCSSVENSKYDSSVSLLNDFINILTYRFDCHLNRN